ncbi:DUF6502 family protein [Rhizobium terrae]|uniref:DUF6502 family protein n=1 Tax=Rhizobium terrae TaxID=2171756 RepID=UPI000E3DF14F|nr:DUF6502 family protein [Rhizobium terrae]
MPPPRPKAPFSEDGLQKALVRILRPLVRLCLASGFTFPAFTALLRRLFIDVAEKDFALPDKQQTDSRISLLTGIHRKDVRLLRVGELPMPSLPAPVSRTSSIIARWLADPRYCDENGRPASLPRSAPEGARSFETLVTDVTRDLRARAVLDEWLDRGVAVIDDDDMVHLTASAIVPQNSDDARHHYFTRNLHDHAAAAIDNLLTDPPPFFERAVHYNNLSPELAAKLESLSRDDAMELLLNLNRTANQSVQLDTGGAARWTVGIYIYRTEEAAVPGEDEEQKEGV